MGTTAVGARLAGTQGTEGVNMLAVATCPVPAPDGRILSYYPLVHALARRTAARLPHGVDVDDLAGAGVLGLIEAVERFDASRGIAFLAYAKFRILGAMLDALRASDWVPRVVRRRAARVTEAQTALRDALGREPTAREIAGKTGIGLRLVTRALETDEVHALVSLDQPCDGGEGARWLDRVAGGADPATEVDRAEQIASIYQAIDALPDREREAIQLYYLQERSLVEVGQRLGVSESRACQLCGQGLRRVRARLGASPVG
jgi:RNA polymerase sigma factor for flagellar operon FliA